MRSNFRRPLGSIDRARLNVKGGSVALGHPFAATGTRIVASLAKILAADAGAKRGLVSVCTAGGMGVTRNCGARVIYNAQLPAKATHHPPMASEQELRQKYRDAVAQLELQEAQSGKLESVLRLLIGRLCLAGRGRDSRLDEELRKIGSLTRNRLEIAQINAALEPLTRAVAALDQIGSETVNMLRGPDAAPPPATDTTASRLGPAAALPAAAPRGARTAVNDADPASTAFDDPDSQDPRGSDGTGQAARGHPRFRAGGNCRRRGAHSHGARTDARPAVGPAGTAPRNQRSA